MSSIGLPEIPGVALWYDGVGKWLSVEVDLAELFDPSTPLEITLQSITECGLGVDSVYVKSQDPASCRVARMDSMAAVWGQVPKGNPVWLRAEPLVGRRWLYENQFSDMILEMLPRVMGIASPAEDPGNVRLEYGARDYVRWAAGQSWDAFVADFPSPFVTKVDRVRVEAVRMLQKWPRNLYPKSYNPKTELPCQNAVVQRVMGMIFGPHPDSERMTLERALLYTFAGFGVIEARTIEFGVGAPADEVLQTMVALRATAT